LPKRLDDLIAKTKEYAKSLRARVLAVLVVVAVVLSLLGGLWTEDWGGVVVNLGTELVGAVATYGLLEVFLGSRERREAKKEDLIAQMGSGVQDVAKAASEELRRHGWLYDGSLRRAELRGANLAGADLAGADLLGSNLEGAHLEGAFLVGADLGGANLLRASLGVANLAVANLEGAFLVGTDLGGADLGRANLGRALLLGVNLEGANVEGAHLEGANLGGSNLEAANLEGAFLGAANLEGANLQRAVLGEGTFDENTTLPDGTKWTPDTDMARFTDPGHPDYWHPGMAIAAEDGHSLRPSKADSVTYHVYENYPENKARIHFSHCPYCNHGDGTQGEGPKTENGEWHGPFATFQEALDAAHRTGRNVSTCKHCKPH